jgi:hypothetical protein
VRAACRLIDARFMPRAQPSRHRHNECTQPIHRLSLEFPHV